MSIHHSDVISKKYLLNSKKNYYFCTSINKNQKNNIMANNDFGSKGAFFGKFVLTVILFIILVIWIYNKNFHFLPGQ